MPYQKFQGPPIVVGLMNRYLFLFQQSSFEENEDTPKRDIAFMPNVNSDDLATRYKHIEDFFLFESSKAKDNGIIDMEFSCANCVNVKKVLKTSTQAPMSNLRAHLRKIHPDLMGRFDSLLRSGFCDLNFLSILSEFLLKFIYSEEAKKFCKISAVTT